MGDALAHSIGGSWGNNEGDITIPSYVPGAIEMAWKNDKGRIQYSNVFAVQAVASQVCIRVFICMHVCVGVDVEMAWKNDKGRIQYSNVFAVQAVASQVCMHMFVVYLCVCVRYVCVVLSKWRGRRQGSHTIQWCACCSGCGSTGVYACVYMYACMYVWSYI